MGLAIMKIYYSELMRSVNKTSGKITYYVKVCDVMKRITREEYDKRYDDADGISCLYTKETKAHWRHYTTAIYEYYQQKQL